MNIAKTFFHQKKYYVSPIIDSNLAFFRPKENSYQLNFARIYVNT